ncbi:Vacuolar fusion protein MON1 A [Clonorchis sinensis]|uniref:Vacuolar fusion protein MON1 homolog n=1 Tax=Clonorchis sinensis TaxID=79923 RepID=A0A8T1MDV3_CLOSI|nr:Vacuolar fusion protein MON1 A [Clonorchis sinensis]
MSALVDCPELQLPDDDDSDTEDEYLDSNSLLFQSEAPIDIISAGIDVQPTNVVKQILAEAGLSIGITDPPSSETDRLRLETDSISTTSSQDISEDPSNYTAVIPDWKEQNMLVFVLSEAGKPIYSRYGDECRLASIMGVMQALVSFVAASNDELLSVDAGERSFVFLTRPHLILVAVGSVAEPKEHLVVCLGYVYSQLLSLLTLQRLDHRFTVQKNLDLRRLLVGDSRLISSIVEFVEDSFAAFLQSVSYLPLAPAARDACSQIISQSVKSRVVVFGLLLHRNHLVSLVRMKGHELHPADIHLIINLVCSSQSLKSVQTHWIPICLPKFDANGFLYANIAFLDNHTSSVLLSVDSTQFYALEEAKDAIFDRLKSTNGGEYVTAITTTQFPSVRDIGVPELRHLVCKYLPTSQYVATEWTVPYLDPPSDGASCSVSGDSQISETSALRAKILQAYRRMYCRLHSRRYNIRLIYQSTPTEVFFAWKTDVFEIYCTLDPLTTKTAISEIRKTLLKWITSRKQYLFCLTAPTF